MLGGVRMTDIIQDRHIFIVAVEYGIFPMFGYKSEHWQHDNDTVSLRICKPKQSTNILIKLATDDLTHTP